MTTFAAFGIGLATRSAGTDRVLDTWYPLAVVGGDAGEAVALAAALGHRSGTATYPLHRDVLGRVDLAADHPVARAIAAVTADAATTPTPTRTERFPVATFVDELAAAPVDAHDVYLRLHLVSNRQLRPHGASFDGAFGLLSNVVWTDEGPCDPEVFDARPARARRERPPPAGHEPRQVPAHDRLRRAVRRADRRRRPGPARRPPVARHDGDARGVRELQRRHPRRVDGRGRISAGVVVGDGSDIGGSASIMGTLSGGGTAIISVGERCLIGANAGIGISLGDGCVVEAGLYVTAGTKVTLPDGGLVKAAELSGRDDLLFRRDSVTGAVHVLERAGGHADWGGLNAALHAND
jgi:2,3,4,5-tetrahydropyridine-2,6-dicarboxylate N-succinyltransferase